MVRRVRNVNLEPPMVLVCLSGLKAVVWPLYYKLYSYVLEKQMHWWFIRIEIVVKTSDVRFQSQSSTGGTLLFVSIITWSLDSNSHLSRETAAQNFCFFTCVLCFMSPPYALPPQDGAVLLLIRHVQPSFHSLKTCWNTAKSIRYVRCSPCRFFKIK